VKLALLTALACTLGCGVSGKATKVSLAPIDKAPPASEYVDQIKKWTRHGHIISDFDETLQVDATLHSPEFRAAYIERWIFVYRVGIEEAARLRTEWTTEVANLWEVHVESATHDYNINNFSLGRTPWRIVLVDDQNREVSPTEVQSSKLRREVEVDMYPYANLFTRGWRIRFPRNRPDGTPLVGPETKHVSLRISGPAGSTDLIWTLR
jgi:hypothetical protein